MLTHAESNIFLKFDFLVNFLGSIQASD